MGSLDNQLEIEAHPWVKEFLELSRAMYKNNEKSRNLPEAVNIILTDTRCKECESNLFFGSGFYINKLLVSGAASYCGKCDKISNLKDYWNFGYNQKGFLPIMKKRLIEHPELMVDVEEKGECSECKGKIYEFYKDLGAYDFYDNYWKVCINPKCNWEGSHFEFYESSY